MGSLRKIAGGNIRRWAWARALAVVALVATGIPVMTVVGASGADATPGGGTANNPFPSTCRINVGLVIDRSNSIAKQNSGNPATLRNAADSFVDSLSGSTSSVAVWSFGTVASGFSGNNPIGGAAVSASDYPSVGFTSVATAGGVTTVKDLINTIPFSTSSNLGATNWEAGLGQSSHGIPGAIAPNNDTPSGSDVVIVLTDGSPTVSNADFSSGGSTNDADVNAGISAADALKGGANHPRIIAVGIGGAVDAANLSRITGGYPASTEGSDYFTTDYANLANTLHTIASKICGGTLTIHKEHPGAQAGSWVAEPGVTFNTTFDGGDPGSLTPASGDQVTDANGQIAYSWVTNGGSATANVVEGNPGNGEILYDSSCNDGQTTSQYNSTSIKITVPINTHVDCTFRNYTPNPQVGITKTPSVPAVTGSNRSVTYTVNITNPSALDSIKLASLVDDKFGDLFDGGNPNVTANSCTDLNGQTMLPAAELSCAFTAQVLAAAGSADDPHVNTVTVGAQPLPHLQSTATTLIFAHASASVNILAPGINLTKTVDNAVVQSGGTATWTMTATVGGDGTPLTSVVLTDPGCGSAISGPTKTGGNQDATLETGESWAYTCTSTITAPTTNTATVNAVDAILQSPVQATANASVSTLAPGIHLTKSVDQPVVLGGTTVTWTMVATVGGDGTSIGNVILTDPGCGSAISGPTKTGGNQDDTLETGESWTYTCTSVINGATNNTATVNGNDTVLQSPVAADATAGVMVIAPAIHLTKAVDHNIVLGGTDVTWTMVATNSGDGTPIGNVVLTDPGCGSAISGPTKTGGNQDDKLEAGESWTYTCTSTITADLDNTATVNGNDTVLQSPVSANATAGVVKISPAIHLTKSVDQPIVLGGTTVTWTMVATNTGDTPLGSVALTDPGCGSAISGPDKTGGNQDDTLDMGETWTYTCTGTINANTVNSASVSATDNVLQSPVSADAQAAVSVIAPGINLAKSASAPIVITGNDVTWTMVATVGGDGTPLTNVVLTDTDCTSAISGPTKTGGNQDDVLETGESWAYTCTSPITAPMTNHASVSAVDAQLQSPVTASATADATAIDPGINLTKTADHSNVDQGATVTWTMTVTVGGDGTPIKDVVLTDPGCGSAISGPVMTGGNSDDILETGETWTYTCTTVPTDDMTNTAHVAGTDTVLSTSVSADASASVTVTATQPATSTTLTTTSTTSTVPTSEKPANVTSTSAPVSTTGGQPLARTGHNIWQLAVVGFAAIGAGIVLLSARRRRA